jgi:DNA modification methylase
LALHPTVKPVAMIADAILDCSAPGDIVLDNFCGVGSTILAAERVGRYCYAIEIDPVYVDTAVTKMGKANGEKGRPRCERQELRASGGGQWLIIANLKSVTKIRPRQLNFKKEDPET